MTFTGARSVSVACPSCGDLIDLALLDEHRRERHPRRSWRWWRR